MKVIFIDIDGVFLPTRAMFLPGQDLSTPCLMPEGEGDPSWIKNYQGRLWKPIQRQLDPVAVSLLSRLVDLSSARVVASTSWRNHPGAGKAVIEKAFIDAGWDIRTAWHEDWSTPHTMQGERQREVDLWLSDHPDVERWIAFEDAHHIPPPGPVYVDSDNGLSMQDYGKALMLLNVLDPAFGPGDGWPGWTQKGEREAIQKWLDHVYSSRVRADEALEWFNEERKEKTLSLEGEDWRKAYSETMQKRHDLLENVDAYADQRAVTILEDDDPWSLEGGPASFLKDPESVKRWMPEIEEQRRKLYEVYSLFV